MSPHSAELYLPDALTTHRADATLLRPSLFLNAAHDLFEFSCWSCGCPMVYGSQLDCANCARMLDDLWTYRRALDGVQAYAAKLLLDEIRRELEDLIP